MQHGTFSAQAALTSGSKKKGDFKLELEAIRAGFLAKLERLGLMAELGPKLTPRLVQIMLNSASPFNFSLRKHNLSFGESRTQVGALMTLDTEKNTTVT